MAVLGYLGWINLLLAAFNPADGGMQFVESAAWIPQFNVYYHLGVDGMSLFLVLLTTFLTPDGRLRGVPAQQKKVEAAGGQFFFDLGEPEDEGFERKFKDPNGIVFDLNWKGWQLTRGKIKNAVGGLRPVKRAAARQTSGWCSRIQRMEQSEEPPVTGRLQVSARNFSSPTRSRMRRACSFERPSKNSMAGPSAAPSALMGVSPGVVTEQDSTPTLRRKSPASRQAPPGRCRARPLCSPGRCPA